MAHQSDMSPTPPGEPPSPNALVRQEFGRRLQKLLDERNWSQADLSRQVEATTGNKMGRDAVSTYINGRSFPTPKSLNQLCQAFGLSKEDLVPNARINATRDEHPAFEMRAAAGDPARAWVRVNRMMSFETACEIARLLQVDDQSTVTGQSK